MEEKKSKKADLEQYRSIFFEAGLALTLLVLLIAFEWGTTATKAEDLGTTTIVAEDEELIPITRQEDIQLPPPPPPQQTVADMIEILDDKIKVDDDLSIDSEAEEDTHVEIQEVVEVEQKEEEEEEPQVFFIVEEMPKFPGGDVALRKYIAENIRYPEMAKENDIQGTVYVRFVVNEKGKVTDVTVLRGVDPLLDAEAVRVVKSLPDYTPGKQRGKAVKVSHSVPIKFALQN